MPFVPGGGNVSLSGHLRHLADGQPDGAVQDGISRSAALDEGCVAGTRSRHSQTDGKIPQGVGRIIIRFSHDIKAVKNTGLLTCRDL